MLTHHPHVHLIVPGGGLSPDRARCDPAGIVFSPQYFLLFDELIEDWYAFGLETRFVEQITSVLG